MIQKLTSFIILFFLLVQCNPKPTFTKVEVVESELSTSGFSEYCRSFSEGMPNVDYIYNRFGDRKRVYDYNEKNRSKSSLGVEDTIGAEEILLLEQELINPELSPEEKSLIELFLATARGENSVDIVFENSELTNASKYILDQSQSYHFLLLNEAHYSSEQRAFTTSLLKVLWENGYRYLAIETLDPEEFNLNKRGYPITSSGYFIPDPVFGNMVREAINLGYVIVPYECKPSENSDDRERIQAKNIYERTFQQDSKGKVIVHAGYSHISKANRGTESLMGYYLNEYVKGQVLSIDQETMSYKGENLNNDYYEFAISSFEIAEPYVFLKDDKVVIDPINKSMVDIQVYHPKTEFKNGRPMWLFNNSKTSIALSEEMKEYSGMLIRAQYATEAENSVPVDQFVIDDEKELILPEGDFVISIVNCKDIIISKYSLSL